MRPTSTSRLPCRLQQQAPLPAYSCSPYAQLARGLLSLCTQPAALQLQGSVMADAWFILICSGQQKAATKMSQAAVNTDSISKILPRATGYND